jgi:hypothetical protein
MYYVCKLMKASVDDTPCPAAYVNEPSQGTSNLLPHLRNKHSINVEGEKNSLYSMLYLMI